MASYKIGVKSDNTWRYFTYLGSCDGLRELLGELILKAEKITITLVEGR